jgi:hypothetical protein
MKSSDKIPAWNITQILRKLIADNHNPAKPVSSLFIFAYIGHGRMNNGQLQMCSGSGKFIQWATIHRELFDVIEDVAHMDVFGFLDCCYAGGARSQMERKVQILAAASEREMTRARTAGISFTQRFGNAVRRLKGSGVPKVTTAKIFDELEKTRPLDAPKAQLSHLGGIGPIALGFKASSNSEPSLHATHLLSLPHTTRDKHVLLHLVLDGDSQIVTREFQKVIEMLPADMQASIVDAYETDASAIVLIRMNHFGWATLSAAVEFEMIGQVIGSSLIHRKMALQQVQTSQQGYENIAPSKRS